jgi:hypothetical protein
MPSDVRASDQFAGRLLNELASKFHITSWTEWYRVSLKHLDERGAKISRLVRLHGGLPSMLLKHLPQHQWSRVVSCNNCDLFSLHLKEFAKGPFKAGQRWLKTMIHQLFPLAGIAIQVTYIFTK